MKFLYDVWTNKSAPKPMRGYVQKYYKYNSFTNIKLSERHHLFILSETTSNEKTNFRND